MVRFCDFPSEVVEKIMLLVPADSLVECKSVNKFWYSCISTLINDPKFVAKHLLITKNHSSMSLLCSEQPSSCVDHCLITYPLLTIIHVDGGGVGDDDGKKDHFRTVTVDLSMPLLDMNRWDNIYHCDGLLLLVNYGFKKTITMMLCNPVLKESMILPKPKNVTFMAHHYHYIGFEHDSRNNKYKCVSIWLYREECKVEVYTVGSDSWREINMSQDVMDYIVHAELCNAVCFGGVCYWYICRPRIEKILSFDMSSEEFRMIDFPDFEPLIAVVDSCFDKSFLFVFTMDKSVAGGSTKYELIGPLEKCYSYLLLPFWKDDEILMDVFEYEILGAKNMVSYNIRTQKFKNVVFDVDSRMIMGLDMALIPC
ncbi:F-box protein At3g08750-like [Cannabis sativa]|uniref:F-box protein At3g08750-like n=1 Tax=Cannabis sativa TaxID=3483 RepID=UPI0029CA4409|nr:F-box protein At3g08750-like [Cannabis sativa]